MLNNPVYKSGSSYIIKSDYPDLDVIRVEDTYYMISTTMHFMPGAVILRSYNLLDWEFASYVYSSLDDTPGQKLEDGKGIYGKGMWAASLRYHKGTFYVAFVANDTHKTYLYTSSKITGPWKKSQIQGFYHDMSLFFEDDGKPYVIYGNTEIRITQLKDDLTGPKDGGLNKIIVKDNKEEVWLGFEGSHFYKIDGLYYLFVINFPKGNMRTETLFVSEKLEGPYCCRHVFTSDLDGWNSGLAQGGIVQANDGKWYGILFQDHGALGRIPVLLPFNLNKDNPYFGIKGKACESITVLDNRPDYKYKKLYKSGFLNEDNQLDLAWQWNHIPDFNLISLKDNHLTIKTDRLTSNVVQAKNTLTQRTFGEKCFASVLLDASKINEGDYAGFCALEGQYAFIAITKKNGSYYLCSAEHKVIDGQEPDYSHKAELLTEVEISKPLVKLALKFDLTKEGQNVELQYFNENTRAFERLGREKSKLRYTLDQFVGVRFALFIFSTKETGGQADFSDFNFGFWQD